MGSNMCLCSENKVIPSEDRIREIIRPIKISNLNIVEIKEKINDILTENSDIDDIKVGMAKIFYESDEKLNSFALIHAEIFENLFIFLESGLNLNQIIFLIFPLSKQVADHSHDLKEILEDLCGKEVKYNRISDLHKALKVSH